MHRLLERLDSGASTLVPLLYLLGLALGAAAYFSGVIVDAGIAVGIGLACAAELHSFLAQRRIRATWGQFQREQIGTPERERLAGQLWTNGLILAALLLFSTYNSIAFVAETWRPAPGFLPDWLQIGIRGSVIPAFFFLSGFLAPLTADAGALLASAAHSMLHTTIKATVKQWQRRVRRARKQGIDLAPVAIALMEDAGDTNGARRIQMIAEGLDAAEAATRARIGRGIPLLDAPALAPASTLALDTRPMRPARPDLGALDARSTTGATGLDDSPDSPDDTPPPTGGPGPRGRRSGSTRQRGNVPATLALVPTPTTRQGRQEARQDGGLTRTEQEALWARDVALARRILTEAPRISTRELARRLSVGRIYTCHPGRATTVRRHIAGNASNASASTGNGQGEAQERQEHRERARRAANE